MKKALLLLGLLGSLSAAPALGQKELDFSESADLIRGMKESLESDPATVDSLAERIGRSSLAQLLSVERDQEKRREAIRLWIAQNPEQAAQIAVGLARDDAEGSDAFETALKTSLHLTQSAFKANAQMDKTIYGRLKSSSRSTRAMKADEVTKDEEKGEIVKTLFEGDGSMSGKILDFGGGPAQPKPGAPVLGGSGFYDGLSAMNIGGYSPKLLALQNSLNARRAPGAPPLIETGRLDHATLSYPSYQMRYDLSTLRKRLLYERNHALAKLLGRERSMSPEELSSEEAGRRLEAEAGAKAKLDPRLAKRLRLLDRIKALLADFDASAAVSRDPARITKELLVSLGSKQKEAARWITVAALEEELSMISAEEGFLSEDVLRAIDACPMPDDAKASYRQRGRSLKERLTTLKANDLSAIAELEADAWESSVSKVEGLLAQNTGLRKDLIRSIRDYAATPLRLASAFTPRPRWRRILDDLLLRFLPSNSRALALRRTESELGRLKDAFLKIAAGDFDAGHQILGVGG